MSEERKPNFFPWIAGILLVLVCVYVGSYYAMVYQDDVTTGGTGPYYAVTWGDGSSENFHLWVEPIFSPIHWLDRRLRPHVWEPKP